MTRPTVAACFPTGTALEVPKTPEGTPWRFRLHRRYCTSMASVPAPTPGPSPVPTPAALLTESHASLNRELRRLTRAATFVALMTSPLVFYWFHHHNGWNTTKSLLATLALIIVFRGLTDVLVRRVIPWPSLFGTDDVRLREEDITNRRRAWTWRFLLKLALILAFFVTVVYVLQLIAQPNGDITWLGTLEAGWHKITHLLAHPLVFGQTLITVVALFGFNFLIFMGPLLLMGVSQIRGYEPGDAEWGVKLDHVRGQAEAKEEIRRVVTLWQSGEVFEGAGGKRERGLLFLGVAGHRQDDDGEGGRDRVQLAVRLDPGLGLRADLHRHRRTDRPLPRRARPRSSPASGAASASSSSTRSTPSGCGGSRSAGGNTSGPGSTPP